MTAYKKKISNVILRFLCFIKKRVHILYIPLSFTSCLPHLSHYSHLCAFLTLSPCNQVGLRCAMYLRWIEYQENGSSGALRVPHLTVFCPLQNNSEKPAPCDPNNSRFILRDRKNEWWIVFDRSKQHLQGRWSIYTAFINASVLTWSIFPFSTLD